MLPKAGGDKHKGKTREHDGAVYASTKINGVWHWVLMDENVTLEKLSNPELGLVINTLVTNSDGEAAQYVYVEKKAKEEGAEPVRKWKNTKPKPPRAPKRTIEEFFKNEETDGSSLSPIEKEHCSMDSPVQLGDTPPEEQKTEEKAEEPPPKVRKVNTARKLKKVEELDDPSSVLETELSDDTYLTLTLRLRIMHNGKTVKEPSAGLRNAARDFVQDRRLVFGLNYIPGVCGGVVGDDIELMDDKPMLIPAFVNDANGDATLNFRIHVRTFSDLGKRMDPETAMQLIYGLFKYAPETYAFFENNVRFAFEASNYLAHLDSSFFHYEIKRVV